MEPKLAPILVFVYNRPQHTSRLIESLVNCELSEKSELFIFIDAPKKDYSAELLEKNKEVKELVRKINHFKKVTIFENKLNKGVDKSILDGVTQIINHHNKVIVLEDDLLVAKSFLKYFNWALDVYERNENIYSVNGFMFPINYPHKNVQLLPLSSAWGWGTWKNRWEKFHFDEANRNLINNSPTLKTKFNLPGVDYASMLISNKECWDINWYFHVFKNNGLNVFPSQSLIKNTGFDGSGVHCPDEELIQTFNHNTEVHLTKRTETDISFQKVYYDYFERIDKMKQKSKGTLIKKIRNKIQSK